MVGVDVAEKLGLGVDSALTSTPEAVLDIAGVYPLRVKVVGVLQRSHTSDDRALFVDMKMAWII